MKAQIDKSYQNIIRNPQKTVSNPFAKTAPEPGVEPEGEADPEPGPEPEAEVLLVPAPPGPKRTLKPFAKTAPEPKPGAEPEPEPEAEPGADPESEVQPASSPPPKKIAANLSQRLTAPESKPEAEPDADPEADREPEVPTALPSPSQKKHCFEPFAKRNPKPIPNPKSYLGPPAIQTHLHHLRPNPTLVGCSSSSCSCSCCGSLAIASWAKLLSLQQIPK